MRSYEITGMGKIELKDIPKPRLKPGHVLVRVAYCAICNQTDMEIYRGTRNDQRFIFGHELSGTVEEAAENCSRLAEGDKVLCFNKAEPDSGFSDYVLVPETHAYAAPREMNLKAVALAELLTVVLKGVRRALKWGDYAGVFGLGPVGLWTLQLARRIAWKVVGVDPIESRRKRALSFGAAAAFAPDELPEAPKESGLPAEFDIAFEATPANEAIYKTLEVLRPDGTLCITGSHLEPATFDMMRFETLTLNLIMTAAWPTLELLSDNAELAFKLLDSGMLDWEAMVSHVFELEKLPEALELVRGKPEEVVKVLVQLSAE